MEEVIAFISLSSCLSDGLSDHSSDVHVLDKHAQIIIIILINKSCKKKNKRSKIRFALHVHNSPAIFIELSALRVQMTNRSAHE